MRRILPTPAAEVDLAEAYAYPGDRWLRLNMVSAADGAAWLKGLSEGLSGKGDRRVFGVLRGLADVVLTGAATVRAEGYGPARPRASWAGLREGRPPAPPIAVVTRRIDLDLAGPLFCEADPAARTIVLTTERAPKERRDEAARHAEVIVAGDEHVDPALALRELAARGLGRMLCEGGPRINAQLAAAGLVDELCLTISPLLTGGDAARILDGVPSRTRLTLSHLLEEDDFLFCKYTREPA
ncbi:pyrimidine reductase family protein [Sphaerisporangium sp. TRM90804]|uniref:pyrimidine reductase family protein n=1 Tax=Sphaerisporangium sp. TRM90804 TaxID=3031113 RepID=UPI00244C346E|nr:pyrimidine reductase family protein [Sphaerisporangium sp. TRM90804]MDH2424236.1 pyrimidine reductase family protein [Sphaerisporangium sp. TRM90804]